jgi:hypothetical protein
MMMTEQNLEIARYSLQDRIRYAEQHELRRQRRRAAKQSSPGTRHRIAAALHRLADRVEPQPRHRRPTLSPIGR